MQCIFLLSILQTDPGAMDDFDNFLGESPRNHWPRVQQIMAESSTYAPHDKGILVSTGVLGKGLVEVDITLHWFQMFQTDGWMWNAPRGRCQVRKCLNKWGFNAGDVQILIQFADAEPQIQGMSTTRPTAWFMKKEG